MTTIDQAREQLNRLDCSCVIISPDGDVTTCHRRGVIDLYELLRDAPAKLHGAVIADKVVGKGAAALMALGQAAEIHARVMSADAFRLLTSEGIKVSCDTLVDAISNRAGTGRCPVETLCSQCVTAAECLPLIKTFVESQNL